MSFHPMSFGGSDGPYRLGCILDDAAQWKRLEIAPFPTPGPDGAYDGIKAHADRANQYKSAC